jgi:hypothetical protein
VALDPELPTTRRKVIQAAIGAAGALAASAVIGAQPVAAAANGNVQLGAGISDSDNDSAAETRINATTDGIIAFSAVHPASGTGLFGYSLTGTGVKAAGGNTATGLSAWSANGTGAIVASYSGSGVYGYTGSTSAPALTGPVAAVVARAADTGKLALRVIGRTSFDFSGKATVAKNKSSVTVFKVGVTTASLIIATPRTNRTGVFVQSVVAGAGKFTIYLNKTVSAATGVAYMILG